MSRAWNFEDGILIQSIIITLIRFNFSSKKTMQLDSGGKTAVNFLFNFPRRKEIATCVCLQFIESVSNKKKLIIKALGISSPSPISNRNRALNKLLFDFQNRFRNRSARCGGTKAEKLEICPAATKKRRYSSEVFRRLNYWTFWRQEEHFIQSRSLGITQARNLK